MENSGLDSYDLEILKQQLIQSTIGKCIEIVKSHIHLNCNNHYPYGECSNCGRSDNPDFIKYPDELLKELENLKI